MSLEYLERPAEGEPEGALVLFHGRGADEYDLFPLLNALDPERRLHGYTPRGPLVLPPGGAHWYVVRQVGYPDPQTFWPTYQRAAEWLDALPYGRIVLGGFSQGAVMSYALGFGRGRPATRDLGQAVADSLLGSDGRGGEAATSSRSAPQAVPRRPAAIIALSGFIPTLEGFELDLEPPLPPLAIAHGTYDPVISVEFGREAKRRLEEAGADVLYRESPLPHTIDPRFLAELRPWLRDVLAAPLKRAG
jgi:phospholipase/carboxylesterase